MPNMFFNYKEINLERSNTNNIYMLGNCKIHIQITHELKKKSNEKYHISRSEWQWQDCILYL